MKFLNLKITFKKFVEITTLVCCLSLVLILLPSTQVIAKDSQSQILSFTKCSPQVVSGQTQGGRGANNQAGAAAIITCFQEISRIVLIFGIIISAILAARDALSSYIPGQEVDAEKNFKERIYGIIIGVIFISLPGAIMSLFNPAATGIDFLSGLDQVRNLSGLNGTTSGGNNSPNPGGGNPSPGGGNNNQSGGGLAGQNSSPVNPGNNPGSSNSPGGQIYIYEAIVNPTEIPINSKGQESCTQMGFKGGPTAVISKARIYSLDVCTDPDLAGYYQKFPCVEATPNASGDKVKFGFKVGTSCQFLPGVLDLIN